MGSSSNKGNKIENVSGLSKNKIKWIRSLHQKKQREEEGVFIVEGEKMVLEAIEFASNQLIYLAHTTQFNCPILPSDVEICEISEKELDQISLLKTPNKAFAILKTPISTAISKNGLIIGLDEIQDPGNMGTILRIADWFGISDIVCSKKTVDCYNPKVVQASMGAILRIRVHYLDLTEYITSYQGPVYGAFLEGENVYQSSLPVDCLLVMGNEGNGVSKEIEKLITQKISIPRFGEAESLNVAVATAILVSEFKRS